MAVAVQTPTAPMVEPTSKGVSSGPASQQASDERRAAFCEVLGSMSKGDSGAKGTFAKKEGKESVPAEGMPDKAGARQEAFSASLMEQILSATFIENAEKILGDAVNDNLANGAAEKTTTDSSTGLFNPDMILQGDFSKGLARNAKRGEAAKDGKPSDLSQFLDTDVEELVPNPPSTENRPAASTQLVEMMAALLAAENEAAQTAVEKPADEPLPDISQSENNNQTTSDSQIADLFAQAQALANKVADVLRSGAALVEEISNPAFLEQLRAFIAERRASAAPKAEQTNAAPDASSLLTDGESGTDENFAIPGADEGKLPKEIEDFLKNAQREREMQSAFDRNQGGDNGKTARKAEMNAQATKTRIATSAGEDLMAEREKAAARTATMHEFAAGLRDAIRESNMPLPKPEASEVPQAGASYMLDRENTFGDGLKTAIQFMKNDNATTAQMVVEPPAIGRLDITIQSSSSGVETIIRVENETLRQMVSAQIENLKSSLQAQGIHVSGLTVDIKSGDEREQRNGAQQAGKKGKKVGGVQFGEESEEGDTRLARLDLEKGLLHWVA